MVRKIIGFTGRMHAGKDTAGEYLCAAHGFRRFAFADALKSGVQKFAGFTDDQLWGESKDDVDEFWGFTPRQMLQDIGVFMREQYTPDFWVKNLPRFLQNYPDTDVVITDVRFPNEVDAIRAAGGHVIRVWRPGTMQEIIQHESERQDFEADHVLYNDSTRGKLYHDTDRIMNQLYGTKIPELVNGRHFMESAMG